MCVGERARRTMPHQGGYTMKRLALSFSASFVLVCAVGTPARATTSSIAISMSGSVAVVSCNGSNPAACLYRYEGWASGSPLTRPAYLVLEIQTTSTWDGSGCQANTLGEAHFYKNEKLKSKVGIGQTITMTFCTNGSGHFGSGTFSVVPDTNGGTYRNATGSGTLTLSDNAGDTAGSTGAASVNESGSITY